MLDPAKPIDLPELPGVRVWGDSRDPAQGQSVLMSISLRWRRKSKYMRSHTSSSAIGFSTSLSGA
jgi:hypothetical protein